MEPIIAATNDIDVNLVFNNAGFITPGFFHAVPLQVCVVAFIATCIFIHQVLKSSLFL
jgi:hypothetical protein